MAHSIAVFDVCGTITRTNNTSDFVGFVLARDNPRRYGLFLLIRILSALSHFLRLRSLLARDRLRDWQIALLRGYPVARLQELAERYVDHLRRQGLFNDRVLEAMKREKERGRTIFLISAAIDPPVVEIARTLQVENCLSSELELEQGHYTGRLRTDLLGNKQSILARMPTDVDFRDSSVYSDNRDDSDFMERFGRRNVILNARRAQRMWQDKKEGFHFLANFGAGTEDPDVHSVNERTVKWIHVPGLYYVISRFHGEGVVTLLVREMVPAALAGLLFTDLGVWSFLLMPLSFLLFYSTYEIGGLVNDLWAKREASGQGTRRIAPGVHIRIGLFLSVRVAAVGLVLVLLPLGTYPRLFYAAALGFCLAVYLIHTLLVNTLRAFTFILLKFCRNSIPLVILASYLPVMTLVWLCTVFFVLDAPWRVYAYLRRRDLIEVKTPVWRMRCINTTVLCGLGAVLYVGSGSPYLFAMALYCVVLECLWILHAARSGEIGWFSGRYP